VNGCGGESQRPAWASRSVDRGRRGEALAAEKLTRTDEFAREMAERLGASLGVRASFELHAGENHMSILP